MFFFFFNTIVVSEYGLKYTFYQIWKQHFASTTWTQLFSKNKNTTSSIMNTVMSSDKHLPASSQQYLSVHLHRWTPTKLSACQVSVVGGVDDIVGQWLVHVHVDVQTVKEDRSIFIRHQIAAKSILTQPLWARKFYNFMKIIRQEKKDHS